MAKVLIQGSGGTIGDIFLSSHPAYNLHLNSNKDIYVAIPKNISLEIKEIYRRHKFFVDVIELETLEESYFLKYCEDNSFEPCLFLKSWNLYKDISFKPLKKWFTPVGIPTIPYDNAIIVQVASSTNYERPPIPNLGVYIQDIIDAGYSPVLMGTSQDESYVLKVYGDLKKYFPEDMWRFGKDTLLQSLSNVEISQGCFCFSSWSSIYSSLCEKTTLELWSQEQWLYYNNITKYLLGSPINLIQNLYNSEIPCNYFTELFTFNKDILKGLK